MVKCLDGWSEISGEYSNDQTHGRTEADFNAAKAEALEAFNHLRPFLSVSCSPRFSFPSSAVWTDTGIMARQEWDAGSPYRFASGRFNEGYSKVDGRETETARHGTGEGRECPHFPPGRTCEDRGSSRTSGETDPTMTAWPRSKWSCVRAEVIRAKPTSADAMDGEAPYERND